MPRVNEALAAAALGALLLAGGAQGRAGLRQGAARSGGGLLVQSWDDARGQAGALRVDSVKPPKIDVDVEEAKEFADKKANKTKSADARKPFGAVSTRLKCGVTEKVTSSTSKDERCPVECPFFAQDRTDKDFCTFSCVKAEDCARLHPDKQIGDEEFGVCRGCIIDGCKKCDTSVLTDRCAVCQGGYALQPDGTCRMKGLRVVYAVLAVVGVLVLLLLAWVVDMMVRPIWNQKGLDEGYLARDMKKLVNHEAAEGEHEHFAFGTNLHKTVVAGPGMLLHFNFQLNVIVWAVLVAMVWMALATFVDEDLWVLGTRKYGTPRDNCILVFWGYETQQRLMWTKVLFLWIVYIGTCVGFVFYSIFQHRKHQMLDIETKTIKDFAAMLHGIPEMPGSRNLEEELKVAVQTWSGETVMGVSVAWKYRDSSEEVDELMMQNLKQRLQECGQEPTDVDTTPPEMNPVRRTLWNLEQQGLGLLNEGDEEINAKWTPDTIKEFLNGLQSGEKAVVVFETEDARRRAVEKAEESGISIMGFEGKLDEIPFEPDTIFWDNLACVDHAEIVRKLLMGFGIIGLACLFWAIVFYAPYAYYVLTFNYDNGRQPGFIVGFSFSMIVVIGNAIMYEVCGRISDWVGLQNRDMREVCYMILYTIACMFNVALDFVTTYVTTEIVLEALGFRTYFGVRLREIDTFTEKFETYGMQRSLAENTFAYAFPSTFLIPFLIEWGPTMAAPFFVGRLIVKSHPEVRGLDAEGWLEMLPMDIGRYADILLNIILGILIFYFPGGYTWTLFLGMAGSHVWIYAFDYYKVLRQIPACSYVELDCEWWCQVLLGPIIGIMPACLVFKSNCEDGSHCTKGIYLISMCFLAWLAHVIVQTLFLVHVLPKFEVKCQENVQLGQITYKECSAFLPATFFSTNPIHCLRSKYLHEHNPPMDFFRPGKEDLMRPNPAIGCFLEHDHVKAASARDQCTARAEKA